MQARDGRPRKLSIDEVTAIKSSEGVTLKALAEKYGVSTATIKRIRRLNSSKPTLT
jgi:transcriptional regulator with XRE-family HTH domain